VKKPDSQQQPGSNRYSAEPDPLSYSADPLAFEFGFRVNSRPSGVWIARFSRLWIRRD